jgi:hypothetical protein
MDSIFVPVPRVHMSAMAKVEGENYIFAAAKWHRLHTEKRTWDLFGMALADKNKK